MAAEGNIIIDKTDLSKYHHTEGLSELKDPAGLCQTYSGVYNFETITKIIGGYKPKRYLGFLTKIFIRKE